MLQKWICCHKCSIQLNLKLHLVFFHQVLLLESTILHEHCCTVFDTTKSRGKLLSPTTDSVSKSKKKFYVQSIIQTEHMMSVFSAWFENAVSILISACHEMESLYDVRDAFFKVKSEIDAYSYVNNFCIKLKDRWSLTIKEKLSINNC